MQVCKYFPVASDRMGMIWTISSIEGACIIEFGPAGTTHFAIEGIGSLNIRPSALNQHIELGYRDALTILAPMIIDMIKGKDIKKLIKKHEEYNKELINRNRH